MKTGKIHHILRQRSVHREDLPQNLLFVAAVFGIAGLAAWLFYDSFYGMIVVAVCFPLFSGVWRRRMRMQRKYETERQFQESLDFAAGALEAGYSAENAWLEAEKELKRLYGKDTVFGKKLHQINQKVRMNEPLEAMMLDFGKQANSENILNFAEVFFFSRKSGGNLTAIMRLTANRLRQNFQVREEIRLAMSSRQLEQRFMSLMPFGILAYLRLCTPDFLAPLYHNLPGILIMTACLILYAAAWRLSVTITDIDV